MEIQTTKDKVKELEVGASVEFPIEKLNIIRTYAYEIGLKMERRYTTAIDKEKRTIAVKRIS